MIADAYQSFLKQCGPDAVATGVSEEWLKRIFYCGAVVGVEEAVKAVARGSALTEAQKHEILRLIEAPDMVEMRDG